MPRPDLNAVREARDLARQRLVAAQSSDGAWREPIETDILAGALYIVMLRATGLCEEPCAFEREAKLVREPARWINPDGGCWRTPDGQSSRALTRIWTLALRLAIGEVAPGSRPTAWFRPNPFLAAAELSEITRALDRMRGFLAGASRAIPSALDAEIWFLAPLMEAYADSTRPHPAVLARVPLPRRVGPLFNFHLRQAWPTLNALRLPDGAPRLSAFADEIRRLQSEGGGWCAMHFSTLLCLMALFRSGASITDPAFRRGHAAVLRDGWTERGATAVLSAYNGDTLFTAVGLEALVGAAGKTHDVEHAAIEFLLRSQLPSGGYTFTAAISADPDADTTAHALQALARARPRMDAAFQPRTDDALRRGAEFLLSFQHRGGGFGCWSRPFFGGRGRPMGATKQLLLDLPTADVAARIAAALAACGYRGDHPSVRGALSFLARARRRRIGWWSRWWTGYLPGASFALRAYAHPELRCGPAARSALAFILRSQNADGGWGETIRADVDPQHAGRGESVPLLSAHLASTLLRFGAPEGVAAAERAMAYLLETRAANGGWDDRRPVFTILARALYVSYYFLNQVLPLEALSDYLAVTEQSP